MSGTPFSSGQLAKFQALIAPSVAKALPQVASKFGDPKRVLKALEGKNELLAERLETMTIEQAIKSFLVLIYRGRITITISETRDPDGWYRTREGLWVWDGFRSRIVSRAKPVAEGTTYSVDVWKIGENLTNEQIEAALPKSHLFEESVVSAILAEMISSQPNGAIGHLENTGRANLLYTPSSVVLGFWFGDGAEWDALAYDRGDRRWDAGGLVFSPAN